MERYASGERDFRGVVLSGQTFAGADLTEVDFSAADIQGVDFRHARLRDAKFCQARIGTSGRWQAIKLAVGFLLAVMALLLSGHASYSFVDAPLLHGLAKWEPSARPGFQCWRTAEPEQQKHCSGWRCNYQQHPGGSVREVSALSICQPTRHSVWVSNALVFAIHLFFVLLIVRIGYQLSLQWIALIVVVAAVVAVSSSALVMFSASPATWIESPTAQGYVGRLLGYRTALSIVLNLILAVAIGGFAAFAGTFLSAVAAALTSSRMIVLAVGSTLVWVIFVVGPRHMPDVARPYALLAGAVVIVNALAAVRIASKEHFALVGSLAAALDSKFGTSFAYAELSAVDFSGADLGGVDFRRARMKHTLFQDAANLHTARLDADSPLNRPEVRSLLCTRVGTRRTYDRLSLRELDLHGVLLDHATLLSANLSGANLRGAELSGADLREADLCGTCLKDAQLTDAKLQGAQLDPATYALSGFDLTTLERLLKQGIRLVSTNLFSEELKDVFAPDKEELVLWFDTPPNASFYWATQATIVNILGASTDCRLVNFGQEQGKATLRLRSSRRDALERVAQAIIDQVGSARQPVDQPDALRVMNELPGQIGQMALRPAHETLPVWRHDLRARETVLTQTVQVFLSCSPEDAPFLHVLLSHLKPLERNGSIAVWQVGMIPPGATRAAEIARRLDSTALIILLVSANYFTHDELYEKELKRALDRQLSGAATVVPILVRAVDLEQTPLAGMQRLPRHGGPVGSGPSSDEEWVQIGREIMDIARKQSGRPAKP